MTNIQGECSYRLAYTADVSFVDSTSVECLFSITPLPGLPVRRRGYPHLANIYKGCIRGVSGLYQGCIRGVLRVYYGSVKGVSGVYEACTSIRGL